MTEVHMIRCDGCDKTLPIKDTDGWWTVSEIVASRQRYDRLVARAEEEGVSGALSGEFCSLMCLASWAKNADTLKGMEPT